jgi:hypothetical protein
MLCPIGAPITLRTAISKNCKLTLVLLPLWSVQVTPFRLGLMFWMCARGYGIEMQLGAGVTLHRVVWVHGYRRVEALVLLRLLTF